MLKETESITNNLTTIQQTQSLAKGGPGSGNWNGPGSPRYAHQGREDEKGIGQKQREYAEKFEGMYKYDPDKKVLIGNDRYPRLVDRYYYHTPHSRERTPEGITAYRNRSADGSQEALDHAFGERIDRVIWLTPKQGEYSKDDIKVDLAQLNPNDLRLTGQGEQYVWHRGDIPESAIVRNRKKEHDLIDILKQAFPQEYAELEEFTKKKLSKLERQREAYWRKYALRNFKLEKKLSKIFENIYKAIYDYAIEYVNGMEMQVEKGGAGSGNRGHIGRPGQVGGSGGGGTAAITTADGRTITYQQRVEAIDRLTSNKPASQVSYSADHFVGTNNGEYGYGDKIEKELDRMYSDYPVFNYTMNKYKVDVADMDREEFMNTYIKEGGKANINPAGFYNIRERKICISDGSMCPGPPTTGGKGPEYILRHELSHHVYYNNYPVQFEWEEFTKKEKNMDFGKEISTYAKTNSAEAFAESCAMYTSDKTRSLIKNKKILKFFDKHIGGK